MFIYYTTNIHKEKQYCKITGTLILYLYRGDLCCCKERKVCEYFTYRVLNDYSDINSSILESRDAEFGGHSHGGVRLKYQPFKIKDRGHGGVVGYISKPQHEVGMRCSCLLRHSSFWPVPVTFTCSFLR